MITDDFLNATVDFNLLSLRDLLVADNGIAAADRASGNVKMRVTVWDGSRSALPRRR